MIRLALTLSALFPLLMSGVSGPVRQERPPIPITGTRLDVDVNGNIFVLDADRCTVTLYDREYRRLTVTGGPGWEAGQFDRPAGIWARNGLDVFIADFGNHRIQRFDRTLSFVSQLETRDADLRSGSFGYPTDVALSRQGTLYLCDSENNRMVLVEGGNRIASTFGGIGAGHGRLREPTQVEIGPHDWVYVLDAPRVVVFDSFGNYLATLPEVPPLRPAFLVADDRGALVLDQTTLVCFDETHTPRLIRPVQDVLGASTDEIRGVCSMGGMLYVLTEAGLIVVPDPRTAGLQDAVEKESKFH